MLDETQRFWLRFFDQMHVIETKSTHSVSMKKNDFFEYHLASLMVVFQMEKRFVDFFSFQLFGKILRFFSYVG